MHQTPPLSLASSLLLFLLLLLANSGTTKAANCVPSDCSCVSAGNCCYRVEENLTPPVTIGQTEDLEDAKVDTIVASGSVRFSFPNGSEVNISSNGTIYSIVPLDREKSGLTVVGCLRYLVGVSSGQPGVEPTAVTLAVQILDVNDNRPTFSNNQFTPSSAVTEQNQLNQTLFCSSHLAATDPDNGRNGSVSYSILSPPDSFRAAPEGNLGRVCIFNLVPLDRETNQSITIILLATDDGVPEQRNGTLRIVFDLTDINDNPPVFTNLNTSLRVFENTPVDTQVFTYAATDPDIGDNAAIVFHLLPTSQPFPFVLINSTLFVSGPLDADGSHCPAPVVTYTFTIVANNADDPQESPRTANVSTITLINLNDNSPQVEQVRTPVTQLTEGNYSMSIFLSVYKLTDSDCDSVSATVTNDSSNFAEVSEIFARFFLSLKEQDVDRETTPNVTVETIFSDNGDPPRHTSVTLDITILDVNDNAPFLTRTNFSVEENRPSGSNIATPLSLYFQDWDEGNNGSIRPTDGIVMVSPSNLLTINNEALMVAATSPDREINGDMIEIEVMVFDNGNPQLNSTVTLYITILDENDNSPKFVGIANETVFSLPENSPPDSFVTQLSATDSDNGENGTVSYSLNSTSPFYIDPETGSLYSNESFDREERGSYSVVVVATDEGSPPLSSIVTLIVSVTDVNDNPPIFENSSYSFEIQSDIPIGTSVGVVSASDSDLGENATVIYELDNMYFDVTSTGSITVAVSLPMNNQSIYTLVVTCYNPNRRDLNGTAWVEITVTFVATTPTPSSSSGGVWVIVMYSAPPAAALLLAIIALALIICCIRCYRHRCQSRDLFKAPDPSVSESFPRKKSSMRSVPVAGTRYEDTSGLYRTAGGGANGAVTEVLAKSPTVNFSEESEVRFYNTEQALNQSDTCTVRVQTEEFELKPTLSDANTSDFMTPTKATPPMETTKISSPCLSDDLSISPSINSTTHDLSHFYNHHSASNQRHSNLPPLREDLLKKHNMEYGTGGGPITVAASRYPPPPPGMMKEPPGPVDDVDDHLPPSMLQGYYTMPSHHHHHHHHNGNIPAPPFVPQNMTPPSTDSSPMIPYARRPSPGHAQAPPTTSHHHHHLQHSPGVPNYLNNGHAHKSRPPVSPRYVDVYNAGAPYKPSPPTHMNGTSLMHCSSSSSSSSFHNTSDAPPPPYLQYPPGHHSSGNYRDPPHLMPNGHLADDYGPQIYVSSASNDHSTYNSHSLLRLRHLPPTHSSGSHYPMEYGGSADGYSYGSDDETGTVASSVLDQYLQFEPPQLRHDFLSLSVDDIKLSSTTDGRRHDNHL